MFIIVMAIIYFVTALMHPQELHLIFYGFLYIVCIPSAYLLLTIYAMVNLNNVSWGTRETKPAPGADPPGPATAAPKTPTEKGNNEHISDKMLEWPLNQGFTLVFSLTLHLQLFLKLLLTK